MFSIMSRPCFMPAFNLPKSSRILITFVSFAVKFEEFKDLGMTDSKTVFKREHDI